VPFLPLDQLTVLPGAQCILELVLGAQLRTRITGYEQGKVWITPRDGRPAHFVMSLRIHVPDADKPTTPPFWDVTAKTLATGLLARLEGKPPAGTVFVITRVQPAPMPGYSLEVVPPGA
jgi:hypothetical protein